MSKLHTISHRTSKLAKEKEFHWETRWYWTKKGDIEHPLLEQTIPEKNHNNYEERFSAPYQNSLVKWLLEKHDIFVELNFDFVNEDKIGQYWTNIITNVSSFDDIKWTTSGEMFKKPEEALDSGLRQALQIIGNE